MQTYVNRFSIALNEDKTEAILNLSQNVPVIPQDDQAPHFSAGSHLSTEVIPVASLVMTAGCARQLATTILSLLEQEAPE